MVMKWFYDKLNLIPSNNTEKKFVLPLQKRASTDGRLPHLLEIMKRDEISKPENVEELEKDWT